MAGGEGLELRKGGGGQESGFPEVTSPSPGLGSGWGWGTGLEQWGRRWPLDSPSSRLKAAASKSPGSSRMVSWVKAGLQVPGHRLILAAPASSDSPGR